MVLNQALIDLAREQIMRRCLGKYKTCPEPSDEEIMDVLLTSAQEAETERTEDFTPVPEDNE